MGIRLNISKTFKCKIKYTLQTEEGKTEDQEFLGEFKRLSQEEVKELINSGKSDVDMVREVLVGWKATDLETHQDVPYSEEIRDALFKQTSIGAVIFLRYCEAVGAARPKA